VALSKHLKVLISPNNIRNLLMDARFLLCGLFENVCL